MVHSDLKRRGGRVGGVRRLMVLGTVLGAASCAAGGGCSTSEFVRVDAASMPREAVVGVGPEAAERAVVVALMDSGFSASRHSNRRGITWACRPIPYTNRWRSGDSSRGPYYEAEVEVSPMEIVAGDAAPGERATDGPGSLVRLVMRSGLGGDPIEDGDLVDRRGIDLAWAFFGRLEQVVAQPSPEMVVVVEEGGPDSVFEVDLPPGEALERLRAALVRRGYVVSVCDPALGLVVADRGGPAPVFNRDDRTGGSTWTVTGLVREAERGSVVRIKTSDWHIETHVPGLGEVVRGEMVGGG